jgi:hypothetical protein
MDGTVIAAGDRARLPDIVEALKKITLNLEL